VTVRFLLGEQEMGNERRRLVQKGGEAENTKNKERKVQEGVCE
jgi:hypothetical protein